MHPKCHKKLVMHSFRLTRDKSAISLLESEEQRYDIKATDNNHN